MRCVSIWTALFVVLPVPLASAADFRCRNNSAEIRCADGVCDVVTGGGFTPMELSRSGSFMTICAYSGCWKGRIVTRRSQGGREYLFAQVARQDTPGREGLAVIHDRRSDTAQSNFLGFANAMDCGR